MARPIKNNYPVSMIVKNERHQKQYEARIYFDSREYKSLGYKETEKEAAEITDMLIVTGDKSATMRNIDQYRSEQETTRHREREEKSALRKVIGDLAMAVYEDVGAGRICSISVNVMDHDGKEYKSHRETKRLLR